MCDVRQVTRLDSRPFQESGYEGDGDLYQGLTTALSLHAAGIGYVYESAADMKGFGVGINLQPNAVRELIELASATHWLRRRSRPRNSATTTSSAS